MLVQDLDDRVLVTLERYDLFRRSVKSGDRLLDLVAGCEGRILQLDFRRVEYMDASSLGRLIRIHVMLQKAGGQLVIYQPQAWVSEIFAITRLDRLLQIVRELEADPCLTVTVAGGGIE